MTGLTNSLVSGANVLTTLSSFSGMSYDASGNRLGETASVPARGQAPSLSRSVTYQYDTLDQLTSETSSGSAAGTTYSNTFTYDLAGNPTTSSRLKGTGFNPDNQNTASVLANGQSVAITYNGTGDPLLLPYQTTTYPATYDPEDRLTSAVQGLLTAAYDGDGLRAWSSDGPGFPVTGDNTYYLYDGDRPIVEEAYTGEDLFFSLFGATGLEGRNRDYAATGGDPTGIAYSAYTYDPQGNLVQPVTLHPERSVGFMVRVDTSSAYDGFGWSSTVGAEGQPDSYSPVGFGGQQGYYRDYTGLYLLTHRYYDAGAGRFVTRDPIGYRGGINLYGFAGNNPVNESDPDGTQAENGPNLLMPPLYDQNPAGPVYDGSAANSQEHPSTAAVLSGRAGHPTRARGTATSNPGRRLSPTHYPNPDPHMSLPPARYKPQSVEEVERMRRGNTPKGRIHGDNAIEAHHRQQIPVERGGIIDELTRSVHRQNGNHTRHQGPAQMTPTQRDREIRTHYRRRGGEYTLPGEGI